MLKRTLLFLCLSLLAGAAQAQIVKNLEFDVDGALPSDDSDIEFRNAAVGGLETGIFSQAGGLLIGNSMPEVNNYVGYAFPNAAISGAGIARGGAFVIEQRVRLIESAPANVNSGFCAMEVWNGNWRFRMMYTATTIRIHKAGGVGYVDVAADVTQFHTMKMVGLGGGRFDAYVDGVKVANYLPTTTLNKNGFNFQLSGSGTGAHAEWDYIRFQADEATVHVEESTCGTIKALYR
jgi:hypothetical protein